MEQLQPKLTQELSLLRKGIGITPLKLQNKPLIRSLAAHATVTPNDSITDNQVYSFLLSELAQLAHTTQIQALQTAFGMGTSQKTLSRRRLQLATKIAKHPDTIERYENQALSLFASHLLERDLVSKSNSRLVSPLYIQELETQAKTTRLMTTMGLSSHLSLDERGEDLMHYLEQPRKPYLDATVHITLLPSTRGDTWYRFRMSYNFQGGRESFRVAVVLDSADGEQLMASGHVDDYHRLDNPNSPRRDIKAIIASSKFIIRNPRRNSQRLLRFRELTSEQAAQILTSTTKPLANLCWLIEIDIPPEWQTKECTYEYLSWINLPIASVAYWYSPTLMYLKKLTLDFSQFPGAHKRDFFLLPFLGHAPGTVTEEKYLYILKLNGWIMPGHGIVLGWQRP